jgi:hypothetical protein
MAEAHIELLAFLHDTNPAVRQAALAALLGHTPSGATHRNLFLDRPEPVRDLKLLCRDHIVRPSLCPTRYLGQFNPYRLLHTMHSSLSSILPMRHLLPRHSQSHLSSLSSFPT